MYNLKVKNPHNQKVIGEYPVSTKEDVIRAVEKAQSAFSNWKRFSLQERIGFVERFRVSLKDNRKALAFSIVEEIGKPIDQAYRDVDREDEYLRYWIAKSREFLSSKTGYVDDNRFVETIHEPLGVCACIITWNYPLAVLNASVIPAIVSGNTVVCKPSELSTKTQLSALRLLEKSGFPQGVVNWVIGGKRVGETLISNEVNFVWFSGTTEVGLKVYRKCGERFIKSVCELSGSSVGVIFSDSDLATALESVYWSRFYNSGQGCSAIKKLYVQVDTFDEVVDYFIKRLKKSTLGNPTKNFDFGPLISAKAVKILEDQLQDAVKKGFRVERLGVKVKENDLVSGNYFQPAVVVGFDQRTKVVKEETYGPLLPISFFKNEEDLFDKLKDDQFGLTAEIYTTDVEKGRRLADKLQVGIVGINTSNIHHPGVPFGGFKRSGIGRKYGPEGFLEFTQTKSYISSYEPSLFGNLFRRTY